jgi:hypothetical protein
MGNFYRVNMRVSLFHLAIIGQWSEIVRLFLSEVSIKLDYQKAFDLLQAQVELQAKQVVELIEPEDAALDGMNAVHLAAKFDPKSLQESF